MLCLLNEFEENGPEPMIDSAHPIRFSQPEEVVEEAELKRKTGGIPGTSDGERAARY